MTSLTITANYNDRTQIAEIFRARGADIAAVIVEPVAGNMGTVLPDPGFLEDLEHLAHQAGSLLIFDEVMTGFRVGWRSAAGYFGITPDLVTLAKVIGAGLPVGAYGGARSLMEQVAPLGAVYQAGTLSGNPLAMAAGLAQLGVIAGDGAFYHSLEERVRYLADGLVASARRHRLELSVTTVGGMMSLCFRSAPPKNFDEVAAGDGKRYRAYFHGMLERGVFMPPSAYETMFVSDAHRREDLDATLRAADAVLAAI
jgi:glutamate-1-semialdehyde 2,1-aminomutase